MTTTTTDIIIKHFTTPMTKYEAEGEGLPCDFCLASFPFQKKAAPTTPSSSE